MECLPCTGCQTFCILYYLGTDTIRSLGDDRIEVELDNTLYIDLYELELKDKAHYEDQYKCVASNGHSTAEAVTHVVVEGAPKRKEHQATIHQPLCDKITHS